MNNITALAKELFIEGKNILQIAEILGVSRVTIYNHKEKDEAQAGISWEELRLNAQRTPQNLNQKEAIFLNSLFRSFDKFLQKAQSDELSDETLEKLHIYAKTYYNLKAPKNLNEKEIELKTKILTIEKITNLAISKKNEAVVNFLAEFADEITKAVSNGN
nr:DUF1804 family protein [Campylobacter sp.]